MSAALPWSMALLCFIHDHTGITTCCGYVSAFLPPAPHFCLGPMLFSSFTCSCATKAAPELQPLELGTSEQSLQKPEHHLHGPCSATSGILVANREAPAGGPQHKAEEGSLLPHLSVGYLATRG